MIKKERAHEATLAIHRLIENFSKVNLLQLHEHAID